MERSVNTYRKVLLCVIISFAALSRVYFAYHIPLSGDEIISLLQATGHAVDYKPVVPSPAMSIHEIKKYIDFSKDYGTKSTVLSLRDAGMHPPFYYLVLHYVIRFLGNDLIVLRSLSILFSLLSILVIYQLGTIAYSGFTGLLSALFLAIVPYGFNYSIMVRPYPLIMFLSILSTLQAYTMVKNKSLSYRNPYCYFYVLTCLIGLYTLYHFLFVIAFQIVFILFALPKDRETTISKLSIIFLIGILYLPWIPSLRKQLHVVGGSQYYFHGQYNLLSSIVRAIQNNFFLFPFDKFLIPSNLSAIKFILSTAIIFLLIIGCIKSFPSRMNKYFIIALFSYFLFHYAGDWLVESRTLGIEKFQFFLVPMLLLILSYGISYLPKGFHLRNITLFVCAFFLVLGSYSVFRTKKNFDGPTYVGSLGKLIAENGGESDSGKKLIIINTPERRYLLPLVHIIKDPVDVAIISGDNIESELAVVKDIEKYTSVFIANLFVPYQRKHQFSISDLNTMVRFFSKKGDPHAKLLFNSQGGMLISFNPNNA